MIVYIDISSCVKEKQRVTKCLFGFFCFAICCGANASVMIIKKYQTCGYVVCAYTKHHHRHLKTCELAGFGKHRKQCAIIGFVCQSKL